MERVQKNKKEGSTLRGIRGKYVARYRSGTNLVLLSPDVVEYFPDEQSVNTPLRSLVEFQRRASPRLALRACGERESSKSKAAPL